MKDQPIEIKKYDSGWVKKFQSEKKLLTVVIKPWIKGEIQHIGSTAIPGLAAKPIIDIMVGVQSLAASRKAINVLSGHDYCYAPYKAEVMHWFCKPNPEFRSYHLHLVPFESELWFERILFRDYLLANPKLKEEYATLKLKLARKYKNNREAYTNEKYPFVEKVLALASRSEHQ